MPRLFADISAHGFGHLAQAAPVLNRLAELRPDLRLVVRSGLPAAKLRQRIRAPFEHIAAASDFGYTMVDALRIDLIASAAAYRAAHADFPARVAAEAELLRELRVDLVFADVAYLPLAGAARAGIPAVALCSLNWADLFAHYFGREPWAAPIHAEMLAAYRGVTFLRTVPGMPMPGLAGRIDVGPIASIGRDRRVELREKVGAGRTAWIGIVALGGIPTRLPIERWPVVTDAHWLVPAAWNATRPDLHALETLGWDFVDLLASADAVVTKPGYGTFAEAACNGATVLYRRREDWPEQEPLIDWLNAHARCAEIDEAALTHGNFAAALATAANRPAPSCPLPTGAEEAAALIAGRL